MTVHPFRRQAERHADRPNRAAGDDSITLGLEHSAAYVVDDADDIDDAYDVDDLDESRHRFGGLDRSNRLAHRAITPPLLAALTGVGLPDCQDFHHVLFSLLESIGDFDGLIATPSVVVGRGEPLDSAPAWLAAHPAIDIDSMIASADELEDNVDLDRRIDAAIQAHSLALAVAVDTNPSLTFGSLEAVRERLVDDVLKITLSCRPDQIEALIATALELLARLPRSTVIVGGATARLDRGPGARPLACLTRDTLWECPT